jgi:hypothetical protein
MVAQAKILELGALQNHGGIDVDDLVTLVANQPRGEGEELLAIASLPLRVGIGEMHPDVAQRECAQ